MQKIENINLSERTKKKQENNKTNKIKVKKKTNLNIQKPKHQTN